MGPSQNKGEKLIVRGDVDLILTINTSVAELIVVRGKAAQAADSPGQGLRSLTSLRRVLMGL